MDSPKQRRAGGALGRCGAVAFDGVGGLLVAGNDVTESCTTAGEREEGEAPSSVMQERKWFAESEAHKRGRGRQCLSAILSREERLGGSGVVVGIASDEEGGGGASGTDERGMG
jgi:hypothetical protein